MKSNDISERYKGINGINYHNIKHVRNNITYKTVAKIREIKFQPFINKENDVLEYGVGIGHNLLSLKCKRRVGYDVSVAGKEICELNNIEFFSNFNEINSKFDVVICHHVLEHVQNPYLVLEQIYEILKDNGKLIFCVPFETCRRYRYYHENPIDFHLFSWNVQTIGNLVNAIGYKIIENKVNYYGYEQRLAFINKLNFNLYRICLRFIQIIRPRNEIFIVAVKNLI